MNWIMIIELGVLIIFLIPLSLAFIIISTFYLTQRKKIPDLFSLIKYFNVDTSKKPYTDWMNKSPALFIALTSVELYSSWYLIRLIKGIKFLAKTTIKFFTALIKWQWSKYEEFEKELDEEEKKVKKK